MKKKIVLLTLMLAVFLALAAPAVAQDENVLRIALQQEPDSLSPLYTQMWFGTSVIDLVLIPLWWIDNTGTAIPAIAAEIPTVENGGVNADGTVITVKINPNAVWSDGEPITSKDVLFTYEMIMNEANTVNSRYPFDEKVASVEAPDAETAVITFNEPFAPWLTSMFATALAVVPEHVLRPVFEAEGTLDTAEYNRAPTVGNGPFNFVSWEAGSGMEFVRNDSYFLGTAKLDGVNIQFVPDDATVVSALIAGDTDVGTFISSGDVPALEETGAINIELVPSGYNEGIYFNVGERAHPAMLDVNVRKALAMAIDRDRINSDLNAGLVFTGYSFWQETPFANPNLAPIAFDKDAAAAALEAAGWVDSNGDGTRDKDGVELVLRYVTNQRQVRKDVQAIVQQDMADIGVGIEILNFESDLFFADYANNGPMAIGEYDLGEFSNAPSFPDPDTSIFTCPQVPGDENPTGSNNNWYCNPALDELFAQQAATVDFNSRVEIFHQIDQILYDEVIWLSMWYDPDLWAINNRIANTLVSGADPLWNAVNWEITG
ncbi:MAG: peptide ABC transporter substrate-binding protein [Anaerolineae bacterium]|nr:peptide ABC transporter substrate-binding protein [Anaerolineae bacterium]